MKDPLVQKEEILLMLTDLQHQLDELEQSVTFNFSTTRKKSLNSQSKRLTDLDIKLQKLEKIRKTNPLTGLDDVSKSAKPQGLKLELGF
ncbi:hypothetical protein [Bacillus massilinigeriensis]|uniref:hypothetical protein n=1 Tax=Bacillus massilionigeriensis TaxID=1805475 RepID=UPI00096ADFA8|nr:hypothetical protein [Bacillus massilionigeriensis]